VSRSQNQVNQLATNVLVAHKPAFDREDLMKALLPHPFRRYLTDTSLAELDGTRDTDTTSATGITTGT
jgi:hypothetical protein